MAYLGQTLVILLVISLCWGKYEILNNQASENVYRSDNPKGPIVTPQPHYLKSQEKHVKFHE